MSEELELEIRKLKLENDELRRKLVNQIYDFREDEKRVAKFDALRTLAFVVDEMTKYVYSKDYFPSREVVESTVAFIYHKIKEEHGVFYDENTKSFAITMSDGTVVPFHESFRKLREKKQ